MSNRGLHNEVFKVGAIDIPLIDITIPNEDVIREKGLEFGVSRSKIDEIIDKQRTLFGYLAKLENGSYVPYTEGEKIPLDIETSAELKQKVLKFQSFIDEVFGLDNNVSSKFSLIAPGGTGINKLHNFKPILEQLGINVEAYLIGSLGQDAAANIIDRNNKDSGIVVLDNDEKTENSRISVVYNRPEDKDRIILKLHSKQPKYYNDVNALLDLTKNLDAIFLEATLIKNLGPEKFVEFAKEIHFRGQKIFFAPPTDRALFCDGYNEKNGINKEQERALRVVAGISDLVTMNEKEAVWFMKDPHYNKKIERPEDNIFVKSLKKIQKLLNFFDGKDDLNPNQVVVVTNGKHPASGFKAKCDVISVEQDNSKKPKFTIGGGDGSAAAVAAYLVYAEKSLKVNFSKCSAAVMLAIKNSLELANAISGEIIQHPPAQIVISILKQVTEKLAPKAKLELEQATPVKLGEAFLAPK
jgi:sugar/nucleoside kinase (ribokinase family)